MEFLDISPFAKHSALTVYGPDGEGAGRASCFSPWTVRRAESPCRHISQQTNSCSASWRGIVSFVWNFLPWSLILCLANFEWPLKTLQCLLMEERNPGPQADHAAFAVHADLPWPGRDPPSLTHSLLSPPPDIILSKGRDSRTELCNPIMRGPCGY